MSTETSAKDLELAKELLEAKEKVKIEQDGVEVLLEHGNIAKARLVPNYDSIFAAKA